MSSFPSHVSNIKALEKLGFDVSESLKDGEVTLESWGYDEITYTLSDVIEKYKSLEQKLEVAEGKVEVSKGLLFAARCPNSSCMDGTITHQINENEWEPEQCQWCYERKGLLSQWLPQHNIEVSDG